MALEKTANTIWRDYVTDGVPASGTHKPVKADIREHQTFLESIIAAGTLSDAVWKDTKSNLDGDLDHAADTIGVVYDDGTASNNGLYKKSGASGSGSWAQLTTFLPGYQLVKASNSDSGDANAITATTSPTLPSGDGVALVRLNIIDTNTSSTVTVAFDGGTALAVKTNSGNDPAVGGLVAGMSVLGTVEGSGTQFRMLSDQASAAVLAEAEGYKNDAEAAAALAAQRLVRVRVVDTGGGDPATDYEAGDTVDGVTLVAADLVLRATSGGHAKDGVYPVPASGAASRSSQFDTYDKHPGSGFRVMEGTANADTLWFCNSNKGGTLDSTAIVIEEFEGGGSGTPEFDTVAALVADNNSVIGYSGSGADNIVSDGDIVRAGGFRYEVATSGAADHQITTAGSVKLYALLEDGHIDVKACNAAVDGSTDDATAIQKTIDRVVALGGGTVWFGSGSHKFGPLSSAGSNIKLVFSRGASVTPVFATSGTEKLIELTGDNVAIIGLRGASYSQTNSSNKYIAYFDGCDGATFKRCRLSNVNGSDGNTGGTNLLTTHGAYFNNCTDVVATRNKIDTIAGAAFFLKTVTGFDISKNRIISTGWYSINCDHDCFDGSIVRNRITGDGVNDRYWGGSINLMSQTAGNPNKRIQVFRNFIQGVHNYGAAIRSLSLSDAEINDNVITDVIGGSLLGAPVTYIALDRRGTAEGAAENGPCENVIIRGNTLRAGTGGHIGVGINNQYKATRDPHRNIQVANNNIYSPSTSAYFNECIRGHGHKCGIEGLTYNGNHCEVYSSGALTAGAVTALATNSTGRVENVIVTSNTVREITSTFPLSSESSRLGIRMLTDVHDVRIQGNAIKGFRYGIRLDSGVTGRISGFDNTFVECADEILQGTEINYGPPDASQGSARPVKGVYRDGHQFFYTNASASSSPGAVCTTPGGAHTDAWASGQTYTAGTWYRNASGVVYELVTAGGGTTANEPSHTTVGQEVTEADGYVWRCRASAAVRWSSMAALGTAIALP